MRIAAKKVPKNSAITALVLLLQPLSSSSTYALEPARGVEPSAALTATEAIVVAGTRPQRRLSETPVATEVITRAQVAQSGARTAADVLETRPGVQIARTFRGAAVRLQGLDPKHVLVLVDGERLSGKLDGAVDLAPLAVADIDSIEIVRGAASALYGSDAIGGVIAISTRKARGVSGGEFRIIGGGFGAASSAANADASGQVTLQRQNWGVRLSGTYQRLADFDLDPGDPQTSGSALEPLASMVRDAGRSQAISAAAQPSRQAVSPARERHLRRNSLTQQTRKRNTHAFIDYWLHLSSVEPAPLRVQPSTAVAAAHLCAVASRQLAPTGARTVKLPIPKG